MRVGLTDYELVVGAVTAAALLAIAVRARLTWRRAPPETGADADAGAAMAERQRASIRNAEVGACWGLVVEAARGGWLASGGDSSIERYVKALEAGSGFGVGEFSIHAGGDGDDPSRASVYLAGEVHECPRAELVAELRRLASAWRDGRPN